MSVNVGTAVGYLDLDTSKFKAGLKTAQSSLSEFTNQSNNAGTRFEALGSSLKTVGSIITTTVSLPLLALGAGAIKTASDFEAGMSKVSALSGATGDDLKMLEDKAREMGSTTKYSATEASEALSYMALSGWGAEQMAAGLEPSLKLAGAAGMQLAECTNIVTDTMSMFGMQASEATKMTDMLAYAQANSNTDVQQLGEALKYCGASANAMGYDLADTTALLGVFSDQGLKGSAAGTTLNAMFRDMKAKAKDGAIAIGDTNVAIVDANGNYRDMTDILADVEKATEGMTQAERDMALSSIWGTEALKGVNMAFEAGVPKIREFEEGIRNSDGAASEMYDTMQNNLKGAIDNMKSAFEGLLITIGQRLIPIFQNLVEGITNVFTWFNNLNPAIQNVIIGVGGFLAVLGPLLLLGSSLISNLGLMATGLMALTGTTTLAAAATSAFGSVMAFITGPIGLTIAAITALIAVGVALIANWDTIKAKCGEIWENIKTIIDNAFTWICDIIGVDSELIKTTLFDTWNDITKNITEALSNIFSVISDTWNNIKTIIGDKITAVKDILFETFTFIKDEVIGAIGDAIQALIDGDWEECKRIISEAINNIKQKLQEAWNKIKQNISEAMNNIKTAIGDGWNKIKTDVSEKMSNIKQDLIDGWNKIKSDAERGWTNIKTAIKTAFKGIVTDIEEKLQEAWNKANEMWNNIKNIFKNPIKAVINLVQNGKKSLPEYNFIESQESMNYRHNTPSVRDYNKAISLVNSDYLANNITSANSSRLINSLLDLGKNKFTSEKQTIQSDIHVHVNVDKLDCNNKMDIERLAEDLAFVINRKRVFR